MSIQPLQWL